MIAENSKTQHIRIKKKSEIGRFRQLSNCRVDPLGILEPGQVVEVLESQEDPETTALRHRIGPIEEGSEAWISDVDINAKATPDPYCVVEVSNRVRGKEMKKLDKYKKTKPDRAQTQAIDDNLTPVWETAFGLGVFPSSQSIIVHVHNDSASTVMGIAELRLISENKAPEVPGPVLVGDGLEHGSVMLGLEAQDIQVKLKVPPNQKDGGEPAGTVVLRLAYKELVSEEDMIQLSAKNGDDLVAGMLTNETERVKFSFRACSNKVKVMSFALTMMNSAWKTRNRVSKPRSFAFKMMNFEGIEGMAVVVPLACGGMHQVHSPARLF